MFLEDPSHFLLSPHFLVEVKDGTRASCQELLLQQYCLMKDGLIIKQHFFCFRGKWYIFIHLLLKFSFLKNYFAISPAIFPAVAEWRYRSTRLGLYGAGELCAAERGGGARKPVEHPMDGGLGEAFCSCDPHYPTCCPYVSMYLSI